jgi:hypothetical protein
MPAAAWPSRNRAVRSQRWDRFQFHLSRYLERLRDRDSRFLVLASESTGRYVQFCSCHGGGILAEAVSNFYLNYQGASRLSRNTRRLLRAMGWEDPSPPAHNYQRRWSPSLPAENVAAVAVRTLRDAFLVPSPSDLELRCDAFSEPARLPGPPPKSAAEMVPERRGSPRWWQLSFAAGREFVGSAVVWACGVETAIRRGHALGIDPVPAAAGSEGVEVEVMISPLSRKDARRVPQDMRNRLIGPEEFRRRLAEPPVCD